MKVPTAQELINNCPKTNLGRVVVRIGPKPITAQEFIDIPDNWRGVDISKWYSIRMRKIKNYYNKEVK